MHSYLVEWSIRRCVDIKFTGKCIFLGGTRSGKSELAEAFLARDYASMCYIATAPRNWIADDPDFRDRVERHRKARGNKWSLLELDSAKDLYSALEEANLPTLVDSIGTWLASEIEFVPDIERLSNAISNCKSPLVFVSEEVGLSIHSVSSSSRQFIDRLGQVNQTISKAVDLAFLVIAGRVLELGPPGGGRP